VVKHKKVTKPENIFHLQQEQTVPISRRFTKIALSPTDFRSRISLVSSYSKDNSVNTMIPFAFSSPTTHPYINPEYHSKSSHDISIIPTIKATIV